MYALSASMMWIFMEGLYLHMLVYKTLFTERTGVRMYVVLGWSKYVDVEHIDTEQSVLLVLLRNKLMLNGCDSIVEVKCLNFKSRNK